MAASAAAAASGARLARACLLVARAHSSSLRACCAVNASSRNVQNYSWRKQLLVVFTFSHGDAALLEREYSKLPAELRANTVLLVTRTNGVEWIW